MFIFQHNLLLAVWVNSEPPLLAESAFSCNFTRDHSLSWAAYCSCEKLLLLQWVGYLCIAVDIYFLLSLSIFASNRMQNARYLFIAVEIFIILSLFIFHCSYGNRPLNENWKSFCPISINLSFISLIYLYTASTKVRQESLGWKGP